MLKRFQVLIVGLMLAGSAHAVSAPGHPEHSIDPKAFSFALKYRYVVANYASDVLKKTVIGCDETGARPSHRCIFAVISARKTPGVQETYISLHDGASGLFACGIVLPLEDARLPYMLLVDPESWFLYQKNGNQTINLNDKLKCLEE